MGGKKVSQNDRLWAAAGYVWVLSILVLALKGRNTFVRDHARQGVLLFVGEMLMIVPLVGWVIGLVSIALAAVGFMKAMQGQTWQAPIVSKWAGKIKL